MHTVVEKVITVTAELCPLQFSFFLNTQMSPDDFHLSAAFVSLCRSVQQNIFQANLLMSIYNKEIKSIKVIFIVMMVKGQCQGD